jgi:hypothetical protein
MIVGVVVVVVVAGGPLYEDEDCLGAVLHLGLTEEEAGEGCCCGISHVLPSRSGRRCILGSGLRVEEDPLSRENCARFVVELAAERR